MFASLLQSLGSILGGVALFKLRVVFRVIRGLTTSSSNSFRRFLRGLGGRRWLFSFARRLGLVGRLGLFLAGFLVAFRLGVGRFRLSSRCDLGQFGRRLLEFDPTQGISDISIRSSLILQGPTAKVELKMESSSESKVMFE